MEFLTNATGILAFVFRLCNSWSCLFECCLSLVASKCERSDCNFIKNLYNNYFDWRMCLLNFHTVAWCVLFVSRSSLDWVRVIFDLTFDSVS